MARGSQKWNGNCADLVKTPTRMQASAAGASGEDSNAATCAGLEAMPLIEKVPVIWATSRMPSASTRPPRPVTCSASRAPARAFGSSSWWPMSRNEERLVISQKRKRRSRSSDRAIPIIAPMNAASAAQKRGMRRASSPAMYAIA